MDIEKKQQAFEVALRELTGANPKLTEALKKSHIDLKTLTDIEVIELFWATELFPIYADKSPHTRRAYKLDLEFVLSFVMTKTDGLKHLTVLDIHRYLFEVNEQYAPRTAQRKNNMLKRLLTYLHVNQYHLHNLAFHVKNQQRPELLRREVDFEEIERIAESFRHTVKRAQKKRAHGTPERDNRLFIVDDRHAGGRTIINKVHRCKAKSAHFLPRGEGETRQVAPGPAHREDDPSREPVADIDDD